MTPAIGPHIVQRQHRFCIKTNNINSFHKFPRKILYNSLYLVEIRKNLACNHERAPAPQGVGLDARSNFVPFIHQAG